MLSRGQAIESRAERRIRTGARRIARSFRAAKQLKEWRQISKFAGSVLLQEAFARTGD
jgi:hypothetical protein